MILSLLVEVPLLLLSYCSLFNLSLILSIPQRAVPIEKNWLGFRNSGQLRPKRLEITFLINRKLIKFKEVYRIQVRLK